MDREFCMHVYQMYVYLFRTPVPIHMQRGMDFLGTIYLLSARSLVVHV